MTLLVVATTIADRCRISRPTTIIGSADENARIIQTFLEAAGKEIRDQYFWPELDKEKTFSIVSGTASYALPADFNIMVFDTQWDRNNHWPLLGPVDPTEWQWRQSGISSLTPRSMYRVKGYSDTQFFVYPTPTASGATFVFEYSTKTWCRPKTWITATVFGVNKYSFYNGNIYQATTAGGSATGATPPTHTTGAVSDGTVTWTYISAAYEVFTADTDEIILNQDMVVDGAIWRIKRELGFSYQAEMDDALARLERKKTDFKSATEVNFGRTDESRQIVGPWAVPDGNFPTS